MCISECKIPIRFVFPSKAELANTLKVCWREVGMNLVIDCETRFFLFFFFFLFSFFFFFLFYSISFLDALILSGAVVSIRSIQINDYFSACLQIFFFANLFDKIFEFQYFWHITILQRKRFINSSLCFKEQFLL